MHALDISKVS